MTSTARRLTLAAALVATTTAVSSAQVRVVRHGDDRLVGIREVDVVVTTSAVDARCPIALSAISQHAVERLRAARITASRSDKARSWHHSIVVHLQTAAVETACVTAVATELVTDVRGMPDADQQLAGGTWGSLLIGAMPLARDKALVIAGALEHDAAVRQAVASHIGDIAGRIRAVNP